MADERALLLYAGPRRGADLSFYLEEMHGLSEAAGAAVVGELAQGLAQPNRRSYLGKGKLEEAVVLAGELGASLALVADELSALQQRQIEETLALPVVDRTALILDIFAQRAQSSEGKLQVELAQLSYLLPRLRRSAGALSRLGGGIGTRGPGESKLETDRRRIRRRITEISGRLAQVERQRAVSRGQRAALARVALVGYTNAGKSTLLSALAQAKDGEDRLFATLDPLTRRVVLPGHVEALVTDTVGFVQDLPTELVAAFRATLEETRQADLLLHVVDAAHPRWREQSQAVADTLSTIGAGDIPTITVYNKLDLLPAAEQREIPPVGVSAARREGIGALLQAIAGALAERRVRTVLRVPHARGDVLALVRAHGAVLSEASDADATVVEADLDRAWAGRIAALLDRG